MNVDRLSIDELADAAGLTRRGIRFYVQQRLLQMPHGVGRGKHYDASHLERLRRIRALQTAGHSLEEIRHILDGAGGGVATSSAPALAPPAKPRRAAPPVLRSELWRHLRVMPGVELSFDAGRFNPSVEQLIALRDAIAATFRQGNDDGGGDNGDGRTDSNPIEESP
jgi:DNA-binding transcriptional MerR regulator